MLKVIIYDPRDKGVCPFLDVIGSNGIPSGWEFSYLPQLPAGENYDILLAANLSPRELEEVIKYQGHGLKIVLDGNDEKVRSLAIKSGIETICMHDKPGIVASSITGAFARNCEKKAVA